MESGSVDEQGHVGVVLLACVCLAPDDPSLIWASFRGRPLLMRSLTTYTQTLPHAPIMLIVDEARMPAAQEMCAASGWPQVTPIAVGPQSRRRDGTSAGLSALQSGYPACEWVIIHEATRPLVTPRLIRSVLERAKQAKRATIASELVKETLKRMAHRGDGQPDRVAETLPRERLARAQTPQVFRTSELAEALASLPTDANPPDEASIAALAGLPIFAMPGETTNLKAASQADLPILASLLNSDTPTPAASGAAPELA